VRRLITACAVVTGFLFSALPAAATPFTFSEPFLLGSASGTITTDGTIGGLNTANITDWNLLLDFGPFGGAFTLQGPLSGNTSSVVVFGTGLSATATSLIFDFGAPDSFLQFSQFASPNVDLIWNGVDGTFTSLGDSAEIMRNPAVPVTEYSSRPAVPATIAAVVTSVPEPLTLSIFGAGVAGMVAMRRKKGVRLR